MCIFFITQKKKDFIIIGVYINDLILGSKSTNALKSLNNQLIKEFIMKDFVIGNCLGL